jgi:pilus assembly protein Flp/PilA
VFGDLLAISLIAIRREPPNALDNAKNSEETKIMMTFVLNSLARLHKDEEGQGLVEYLLILALVAFAATAGMGSLASYLNIAFSDIGSLLNAYIS